MRLHELTGAKRYRDLNQYELMRVFLQNGGEDLGSGEFGTVVGHPRWPYVIKFFYNDPYYLQFVAWAIANPGPHVPRIYGKPLAITPFFRRPRSVRALTAVRIERLTPITDPAFSRAVQTVCHDPASAHVFATRSEWPRYDAILADLDQAVREARRARWSGSDPEAAGRVEAIETRRQQYRRDAPYAEAFLAYPALIDLQAFYWDTFVHAPFDATPDMHGGNVMARADGTLVLTDPLWSGGPSPAEVERLARALDADAEEEDDDVPGGRVRPTMRPSPPEPPANEIEIPF